MIISYLEIKEAMKNSYEDLHLYAGYSIKDTLYSVLADYESHPNVTETHICCIYLNLGLLFIENTNISFIIDKLSKVIDGSKLEEHKLELKDEFEYFYQDLLHLREREGTRQGL